MYPKIIAYQDSRYIVQTSEDKAYVYDTETKYKSKEMHPAAFIKFGYWEVFEGDQSILKSFK